MANSTDKVKMGQYSYTGRKVMGIDQYGNASSDVKLTQALVYNANSLPIYIGEAQPGTLKSEAKWRIQKLTYSGNNVTDIQWASSAANFNKIWMQGATTSYTGYNYS